MDRLANKVEAVNRCHKLANEFDVAIQARLKPWIGKKITKADGAFTERFKASIQDLLVYRSDLLIVRAYQSSSAFNFEIQVNWPVSEVSCDYYKTTTRPAFIKEGLLDELRPEYIRRTDYVADEIRQTGREIRAASELLQSLESKLIPFQERDINND